MSGSNECAKIFTGNWTDMSEETPAAWAMHWFRTEEATINCYFKVRLLDGREISSRWEGTGWSVERYKPALKVIEWLKPPIIA